MPDPFSLYVFRRSVSNSLISLWIAWCHAQTHFFFYETALNDSTDQKQQQQQWYRCPCRCAQSHIANNNSFKTKDSHDDEGEIWIKGTTNNSKWLAHNGPFTISMVFEMHTLRISMLPPKRKCSNLFSSSIDNARSHTLTPLTRTQALQQ